MGGIEEDPWKLGFETRDWKDSHCLLFLKLPLEDLVCLLPCLEDDEAEELAEELLC